MLRVREYVATRRLWRIAVLTAAAAMSHASHAEAALYYWSDSDPGFSQPGPPVALRRQHARRHHGKKVEASLTAAKPQGPLIIAISIQKQRLKVYDAAGVFAESPISSGMAGHPTPMGVFSVIQKQRLHHSNIYSGAPMPYMQRITWSGIAIHAGVLPGYPASHGCIRMPMAFAMKMWNWTKMGARVVVTPGEMTPSSFSHPLLATHKVVPQPAAANAPQTDAPPAAKADKAADTVVTTKPVMSEAGLELRSTVGHGDGAKPAATPLRDKTHTADASSDLAATKAPVTMTDAAPSGSNAPPREEPAAATDSAPGDIAATDEKPGETTSSEYPTAEIRSAETGVADEAGKKPDQAGIPAQASVDAVKTEAPATEATAEAKADDVKLDSSKPDAAKAAEKPDDTAK